MAGLFPVLLSIEGKLCIVVGGGSVAERKVKTLLDRGAVVRVISPDVTPAIGELVESDKIELEQRRYEQGDLAGAFLCVVATGDRGVNEEVRHEATARRAVVNVADDPWGSDYHVPSFFEDGPLLLAVSTSGTSPAVARTLRRMIQGYLGDKFGEALEIVAQFREEVVKKEIEDVRDRVKFWEAAVTPELLDMMRAGDLDGVRARLEEELKRSV